MIHETGAAKEYGGRDTLGSASVYSDEDSAPLYTQTRPRTNMLATYDVLRYIRSTFDDAAILDSIPLEAAGNPGAWHAWRTHRRQQARNNGDSGSSPDAAANGIKSPSLEPEAPKVPGEWNWDHVWEERVTKGINTSLSDTVLYGSPGTADDVVRVPWCFTQDKHVADFNSLADTLP